MDDAFEVIDPRFRQYSIPIVWLEKLHGGMRWAEGPVYFADLRCLIWSDLPNNRMLRLDEESGTVSIFRAPSNYCQRQHARPRGPARHLRASRRGASRAPSMTARSPCSPTATRASGSTRRTTWWCERTARSGSPIRATASPPSTRAARRRARSAACNVYRFDPRDGSLRIVADDFKRPNGLAFSPDESLLYIADSGFWPNPDWPHHIRAFDGRR